MRVSLEWLSLHFATQVILDALSAILSDVQVEVTPGGTMHSADIRDPMWDYRRQAITDLLTAAMCMRVK